MIYCIICPRLTENVYKNNPLFHKIKLFNVIILVVDLTFKNQNKSDIWELVSRSDKQLVCRIKQVFQEFLPTN